MRRELRKPNFFLVGAPKCGTTAMHAQLRQHPDVYMPESKENNHFATDLLAPDDRYRSRDAFLALFRSATQQKVVGDASVFHLFSKDAARNIHEFDREARILVMLRNPVDWLASYHSQMVYNGDEDLEDLEAALAAEADRRQGRRTPSQLRFVERLFYTRVVRFSEQLERYIEVFGRDAVHVVLHEDFRRDPAATYRATLGFLEVDDSFRPQAREVNPHKELRTRALNDLIRRPPAWMVPLVTRALPRRVRRGLTGALRRVNTRQRLRSALPPALRRHLEQQLRPEVERLSRVIDRDLSGWCPTGGA